MKKMKSIFDEIGMMRKFAEDRKIDPKRVYTREETATIIGVSDRSIYRYIDAGRIKTIKQEGHSVPEVTGLAVLEFIIDENLKKI